MSEPKIIPTVESCIKPVPNWLSRVGRNHARILNHRDLINRKIDIGRRLGLIESPLFPSAVVQSNHQVLDQLQRGQIAAAVAIQRLYEASRSSTEPFSEKTFYQHLDDIIPAGHIELHPTDVCDHKCVGCYYADKGTDVMPLEYVPKILKTYRPKSVVLVGGGEPTLYRYKNYYFGDLVAEIKRTDPRIQIGLVTKGTHIPPGDWQKDLNWIRVSIDSATPETFYKGKCVDAFSKVVRNYFEYLKGPIPNVGIGYLVWSGNIHETYELPRLIYHEIKEHWPDLMHKVNIQYRPMRPCAEHPEKVKKNHVSDEMICSQEQVVSAVRSFETIMEKDAGLKEFIQEHTNWYKVCEGNGLREGKAFDNCYYTLAFKMFRPTGEVYSCFARVSDPEYLFGNYMNETREELYKINLLSFLLFNRKRAYCDGDYCRIAWLNNIAEVGLKGKIPMPTGETAESYFF